LIDIHFSRWRGSGSRIKVFENGGRLGLKKVAEEWGHQNLNLDKSVGTILVLWRFLFYTTYFSKRLLTLKARGLNIQTDLPYFPGPFFFNFTGIFYN
jgi:hypothetical protein